MSTCLLVNLTIRLLNTHTMASQKPFLDVQNLTKTFGAQVIFDNISFSIAEGQKVGLIAKNGTGKSRFRYDDAGKLFNAGAHLRRATAENLCSRHEQQ